MKLYHSRKGVRKVIKNKKNGFTLVELLAVIVILAIILVIAVPKVINVINDSKKATLESTAKMIASAAEKAKMQNNLLGNTGELKCENVVKLNDIDYKNCSLEFEGNIAKVSIEGVGKFEGLHICNGTKTNASATNEKCVIPLSAKSFDTTLCKDNATCTQNNLMKDDDNNLRYYGANPNNYIKFNNEVWRIIGVFNVKKNASDTETEKRLKIIRADVLEQRQYDADSNVWIGSDLEQYLNGTTEGNYYYGLTSTAKSQIEKAVWNTGSVPYSEGANGPSKVKVVHAYESEKQTQTAESIVGLVSASDLGYAQRIENISGTSCAGDNWLKIGWGYWTITSQSNYNKGVWATRECIWADSVDSVFDVFPVVYLKSNVKLTGTGENTEEGIYKIS